MDLFGFVKKIFGNHSVPTASAKQVRSEFGPGKALLLDVRTPQEYKEASIRGSILIPVDTIEQEIERVVPNKDAKIFLYCRRGRRSEAATNILINKGYKHVFNMEGGITAWQKLGYPVL